jgi:hypothetical protein
MTCHKQLLPAQKNTANDSLVDPKKIFPPQFHLKLGLMKNYVKSMNRNGESFRYLVQTFPRIRDVEIKEVIFVGPQINEITNDRNFDEVLEGTDKTA